ncbi:lysosomal Pro-X carboxypeptidase isoform X2 [Acomys russatus]|uniref:lysosomal Pro-X carboxypeptidase isoform X2 n=1 Tax=Acomys russatus TaxID=60746 RepID=UPI0021E2798A|nr:lysosomal Pro-X carboxypeptidase isoform X2 [Acomys russatus]
MGCQALLLLVFLSLGAAATLRPGLKTFGSLHLSANPTSNPAIANNYSVLYFEQKVDHFGFSDTRTFKQRYLIADKHWQKNGGSILLYTGNEGDIVWFSNNTGFMWDVAEELKAMLVFAEHRYYGESLPFGEDSFKDSQHLNFLSSEQALADFAELIRHLKKTIPGAESQPVIAIGGSYGGMLAAWFRMKYPHIVVGALAASAPIWQFEELTPCGVFMKIVTQDFRKSGPHCSESIRKSWGAINQLSSTSSGLQWLTNTLRLCRPLTSEDVPTLKGWITETWVNLAMVNYPYATNFLQPLPAWPIKACTEMVMPFCTNGVGDMFEPSLWDLEKFSDDCFNQWGVKPRPHWMTTLYGGKNISSHSNIVFSNGDLDPWSGGGVTKDISDTLVAIIIPDGAHHLDLRAHTAFDPSSVLLSRSLEVKHMKKWIADFYSNAKWQS